MIDPETLYLFIYYIFKTLNVLLNRLDMMDFQIDSMIYKDGNLCRCVLFVLCQHMDCVNIYQLKSDTTHSLTQTQLIYYSC